MLDDHDPSSSMNPLVNYGSPIHPEENHYIPNLPMSLFRRISLLGTAGMVYLLIWRESKMRGTVTFSLSTAFLERFGFSRKVKATAIEKLETAGLIAVVRQRGKNPRITLQ
jgi:hypothetical protein